MTGNRPSNVLSTHERNHEQMNLALEPDKPDFLIRPEGDRRLENHETAKANKCHSCKCYGDYNNGYIVRCMGW
jgi:hypothetical protein